MILLIQLVILCVFTMGNCQVDYPFRNISLDWGARVQDIISRLQLNEMQAQMAYGGAPDPAPAIGRLGIAPYQWDTECLHGDVGHNGTAFPQSIGLAATFNPRLIYKMAEAVGEEVRAFNNYFTSQGDYGEHKGLSCFSPVLNIHRDPRWGRNQETYGEDPYMSGVYADNFIRGLQGDHPRYIRASGGCKHFDVHGGPENIPVSRFSFNAKVSAKDWKATFQPAFKACVKAGTYSLMCSYNSINGIPACANQQLLTDVLRHEWGFTGYVVSDEGAIENVILRHGYKLLPEEAAAACVNAGTNLNLPGAPIHALNVFNYIEGAVKRGLISEDTLKERLTPLFYTRMKLGEFDPPQMNPYRTIDMSIIQSPAHRQLALQAAMESFVLLKNMGNFLPLKRKVANAAVLGPLASNAQQLFGDYAATPDPKYISTPYTGLIGAIGDVLRYNGLCDNNDPHCSHYDADVLRSVASQSDLVILCLGTGQAVESEGNDRPNIDLPGQQKQILQDVITYTKGDIILLTFSAGPLDISPAVMSDKVVAILHCFFPAQATGEALRNVLLNDGPGSNPAGRLPFTWYSSLDNVPPITDYTMTNRTYRYIEDEPLYPFGYGLSYTRFTYTSLTISPQKLQKKPIPIMDNVTVVVGVKNIGAYDGDEAVQFYIHIGHGNVTEGTPVYQLAGFDRVFLQAGQETWLKFTLTAEQLALVDDEGREYITTDEIIVYAGGQQPSQNTQVGSNILHSSLLIYS